jgi:hypothetical protein
MADNNRFRGWLYVLMGAPLLLTLAAITPRASAQETRVERTSVRPKRLI